MTKTKKVKTIKVDLLPEDFVGNDYTDSYDCPLTRASKRTLGEDLISCNAFDLTNGTTRKTYKRK